MFFFIPRTCNPILCSSMISMCSTHSNQVVQALKQQRGAIVTRNHQVFENFQLIPSPMSTNMFKDYENLRGVFNAACTARPLLIVRVKTVRDISTVVKVARRFNLPIRLAFASSWSVRQIWIPQCPKWWTQLHLQQHEGRKHSYRHAASWSSSSCQDNN